MINKSDNYSIIISTGDLDNEYLEAEIYNSENEYICSLSHNGTEIMVDVTFLSNDNSNKRYISLNSLITAINDALKELEIKGEILFR